MKRFTLFVLVVATAAVAMAGSLKSDAEAANKGIHKAMMAKDFVMLEKLMKAACTKDFKYVENGKTMNFDQMMSNMKQGMMGMKKVTEASSKIVSVKEGKTTGSMIVNHKMAGLVPGEGKDSKMEFLGTATEYYVKVGGKWKMNKMVWGKSKMLMDGKEVPMGG